MDHQGSLGQSSSNTNIQNGADPQEFPHRLLGSNLVPLQEVDNISTSDDHVARFLPHNLDLNESLVENYHYTDQNVSVGLSLHPCNPDGQDDLICSNSSDLMEARYRGSDTLNEILVGSRSEDMSFLSSIRAPEYSSRELLVSESSSTSVQARFPVLQDGSSRVNASNNLNRSSPYNGPANVHQRQSVAGIGHSTIRSMLNMQQFGEDRHVSANIVPVSFEDGDVRGSTFRDNDLQHSSHARQTSNINSIHHQTAADPNMFLMPNIFSLGQARNTLAHLPRQTPWYHQHENQPPYSPTRNSAGVIPYMQPIVPVSNSHETLPTSPWANTLGPRGVPPLVSSGHTVVGGRPMESLNSPRSIMLGPQTGRRVHPRNGTANFLGNFTSPSQYVSSSHLSNAPTEVPGFNTHDQPILMLPRVGNVGNNRSQNRYRMVSRSWRQSAVRREPLHNNEARNTLVTEVRNALERLRNGELVRAEEFIILDYSLLVLLLEERHNQHLVGAGNEENPLAFLGLNEDFVMLRLGRDKFRPSRIGDPGYAETCCICQENYVDGDDIGLLNCLHRFHVDCIKQWLVIKNCCPICKQIGLYV